MNQSTTRVVILDGSEDAKLLAAICDGRDLTPTMAKSNLDAEARAMLQALYSRSPKSVVEHVRKVVEKGADQFMRQYYVNYGHKSIGDCGFVTIFVEGCSMLVAKAIQDNRLYNGQEASTRYLDFSELPFLNPLDTENGQAIIDNWRTFYELGTSSEELRADIKKRFPQKSGEKDATYERAISARIFDVMRGFLPFSATTFVAWTTNLRQAADKIAILRNHPLAEVRQFAEVILAKLKGRYPSSFSHKPSMAQDDYLEIANLLNYYDPDSASDFTFEHSIDMDSLNLLCIGLLRSRPKHMELPGFMEDLGQVRVSFMLDGGSWRDLQRHRACIVRFPLFRTTWGFYPWYLDQLTPELKEKAERLIASQTELIDKLPASPITQQCYLAMGFQAPMLVTGGLPAIVYMTELRTGKTVHPTLRQRAQQIALELQKTFPEMPLHVDLDPNDWDAKRGTQTIMTSDDKAIND
ncbi:MAG: FAD-dependent thymidylate synthase [bacterium]|nr:FAD-dependent thymidylate synthase [bacterium]